MNELSAVLATSCPNRPTLTLAADGTIVRKDGSGATMTFYDDRIRDAVNAAVLLSRHPGRQPCRHRRTCTPT